MAKRIDALAETVQNRLGECLTNAQISSGQLTIECAREDVLEVCTVLRDDAALAFEQLVDLCAVDYLEYGHSDWQTSETATGTGFSRGVQATPTPDTASHEARFAVVYHMLSHTHNTRVRLRVFVPGDPPVIESVTGIWNGANWYEREAFDLFGVLFQGHDDLRRLLTDYGFVGHPFRKDFPLVGEVEMRYDPELARVVYEPTKTEMRILVPKVIRQDNRSAASDEAAKDEDQAGAAGG